MCRVGSLEVARSSKVCIPQFPGLMAGQPRTPHDLARVLVFEARVLVSGEVDDATRAYWARRLENW